jgi:hypothetical protein
MDRVTQYRDVIYRLLEEYRNWYAESPESGVDTEIIADDVRGHFLLMRVGWHGETRIRRAVFYLRLKDDKIWIEEDWTKEGISSELVAAGVPQSSIVLAFNPPFLRPEFSESKAAVATR